MSGAPETPIRPLAAIAVRVDPADNCAVVKTGVTAGTEVRIDDRALVIRTDVGPGHRFALVDIHPGEFVVQYAQPIGTSLGVLAGDAITEDTMSNDIPVVSSVVSNFSI